MVLAGCLQPLGSGKTTLLEAWALSDIGHAIKVQCRDQHGIKQKSSLFQRKLRVAACLGAYLLHPGTP